MSCLRADGAMYAEGETRNVSNGPEKIKVSFVHPTDSTKTLNTAVSRESTPNYLIEQMVKSSFIQPPPTGGSYKLRTVEGVQLLDTISLNSAGLSDGATLIVETSVTGAGLRREVGAHVVAG